MHVLARPLTPHIANTLVCDSDGWRSSQQRQIGASGDSLPPPPQEAVDRRFVTAEKAEHFFQRLADTPRASEMSHREDSREVIDREKMYATANRVAKLIAKSDAVAAMCWDQYERALPHAALRRRRRRRERQPQPCRPATVDRCRR
jgi:hypothetical protein